MGLPSSTRLLSSSLVTLSLVACDDPFAAPSVVDGVRVLAIRAEPPELRPGERSVIDALVVSPEPGDFAGLRHRWRTCILPPPRDPRGGFAGFAIPGPALEPASDASVDCATAIARGERWARELGEGTGAVIEIPTDLLDGDAALRQAYELEGEIDDALRAALLTVAGIPVRVELSLADATGSVVLVAAKHVRVFAGDGGEREDNANPPAPLVALVDPDGDPAIWPTRSSAASGCLGAPSPFGVGTRAALVALDVPDATAPYQVLVPASGGSEAVTQITRVERWTWSLFATTGRFSVDVMESEPRPVSATWRWSAGAPAARTNRLWIVLRDGRGGVSWCESTLAPPP